MNNVSVLLQNNRVANTSNIKGLTSKSRIHCAPAIDSKGRAIQLIVLEDSFISKKLLDSSGHRDIQTDYRRSNHYYDAKEISVSEPDFDNRIISYIDSSILKLNFVCFKDSDGRCQDVAVGEFISYLNVGKIFNFSIPVSLDDKTEGNCKELDLKSCSNKVRLHKAQDLGTFAITSEIKEELDIILNISNDICSDILDLCMQSILLYANLMKFTRNSVDHFNQKLMNAENALEALGDEKVKSFILTILNKAKILKSREKIHFLERKESAVQAILQCLDDIFESEDFESIDSSSRSDIRSYCRYYNISDLILAFPVVNFNTQNMLELLSINQHLYESTILKSYAGLSSNEIIFGMSKTYNLSKNYETMLSNFNNPSLVAITNLKKDHADTKGKMNISLMCPSMIIKSIAHKLSVSGIITDSNAIQNDNIANVILKLAGCGDIVNDTISKMIKNSNVRQGLFGNCKSNHYKNAFELNLRYVVNM